MWGAIRITRLRPLAIVAGTIAAMGAGAFADPPARNDDLKQSFKDLGKSIGEAGKELGTSIGEAGRKVGQDVAAGAKDAWYKGKKVSRPLLADLERSTRAFWNAVIEQKDRAIASLERENKELKQSLAKKEPRK